ncbi:MAG: tRNA (N6-threonylcarbamoyladenosine(37)-N6)-methyltransferase TrmO [Anaerolineales bacterium]|nr:tRNA (N6-threonylcarbamoyladenosine(37)-N6)-methyltransferase TrmO [Anaerolineales bacterium]
MFENNQPITFYPIGFVENDFYLRDINDPDYTPYSREEIKSVESRIVLNPDLTEGLTGYSPGQQMMILFYIHRSKTSNLLQHPRGDVSKSKRGVFNLRSPHRPNPIGVTVVEILQIVDNKIHVRGLDAIDGTPVLDIKPV